MPDYNINFSRYFIVCCLLLLFSACSTPVVLQDSKQTKGNYLLQNKKIERARSLAAQGDYLTAAKEFWSFSKNINPPHKQSFQITAVEYLIKGNLIKQALTQLGLIRVQATDKITPIRMALARAEIQIAQQQPQLAQMALKQINVAGINTILQKRHFELQALAHETLGEYEQGVNTRLSLDVLLRDSNRQLYNQKMLWNDLLHMDITQLSQPTINRSLDSQAWYALGLLAKTVSPNNYPKALSSWQQRYPQHPIRPQILNQINSTNTQMNSNINRAVANQHAHLALLLPKSGGLKNASQAIEDAFMAAWSTANPALPRVQIYDVSDSGNIVNTYNDAVNAGAQLIIGPLRKGALATLAQTYEHFPVPTVALNRLSSNSQHSNLFQFSLSPEGEAAQVALVASRDGKQMATALIPDNQWGRRLLTAFQQSWSDNGGLFLGHSFYVEQDLAKAVKDVIYNNSQTDMLFLAASPQDGRRLVPQIRYALSSERMISLNKINLPIYSTSHVYSNKYNPMLDRDLDNVIFVDMPWLLNPAFSEGFPDTNLQQHIQNGNKRLFAFGLDAYEIVHYLYQSRNQPQQLQINGATGQLNMDAQGIIHRQLNTGMFKQGRAVLR